MSLYDTDFFEWTRDTATKIREHRFACIDLKALAEEIEDLGKSARSKVYRSLTQLLAHLLKWQYPPEYRQRAGDASWQVSIVKQRQFLKRQFKLSPSLYRYAQEDLEETYGHSVLLAEAESGLKDIFPPSCPYRFEQILEMAFYPLDPLKTRGL